ncbi:MAG: RNA polymerase sigma factor [Anaerolineae bacterium]|nr:RNA polymerase sigma factor [Anaerolineae bacterium]
MASERKAERDAAFEQLFRAYQRPILNYLYRLLGDVSQAEELAQDVFLRAYRALGRLSPEANRRAWLYRIATNAAYDHLRRRKLIQWLPLLGKEEQELQAEGDPEGTVVEREAVQRALAQIPLKYRVPLVLFSVQGYSTKEIGEILGISEGAVKTRLYRAREKFREVYGGSI